MTTPKESQVPTPAYVGWPTFKNYVARLKGSAVPPVIDASVMPNLSGGTQSQLKGAMRFLGYITDADAVTEKFRALISAFDTEDWAPLLAKHLPAAYRKLTGDLDLGSATMTQLKARFRDGGAFGSTLDKAVRFYLASLKEAGVPYSPHFDIRGAMGPATPRKPRKTAAKERQESDSDMKPPEGEAIRLRLPNAGEAVLYLPTGTTEEAWGMVDAYVRAYLKLERKK